MVVIVIVMVAIMIMVSPVAGRGAPGSSGLATRTRSSVTYSIADSHAIVSLANDHNLEDPPHAGTPVMHAARKAQGAPEPMLQPSDSQKSQFPSNLPLKTASASVEQATIGGSVVIKGEVSGSESLYIDGRIEGTVNFADNRVTIARNGSVAANISAGEVVILGTVQGNIQCSDRLDIRSEGSLTGDVVTQRISVEDGAVLKGSVQVRAVEHKNDMSQRQAQAKPASAQPAKSTATEQPKAAAAVAGT